MVKRTFSNDFQMGRATNFERFRISDQFSSKLLFSSSRENENEQKGTFFSSYKAKKFMTGKL